MIERMYNIKETAKILHKHPKTVRRYVKDGSLHALRSGVRSIVIPESALNKFMNVGISEEERVRRLVNERVFNTIR